MNTVVHFIRKSTQLRASFIRNQILSHRRYAASVVFKHFSTLDDGGYASHDTAAGLPVLDLSRDANFADRAIFKLAYRLSGRDVRRIGLFLQERRARLLHFHYGSDAGMYAPVMRRFGLPSVVSFYGYDCSSFPRMYFGYGGRFLRSEVFAPATRVLAMSKEMRDDLVALGCPEEKVIVHYFGSDIGRFLHPGRDYARADGPVRLLILASFVPQKGHRVLLEALGDLLSRGVDGFALRIVGDGPLREELVRQAGSLGLSGHVSFHPPLVYGSPEMIGAYREADVFVHPSVTSKANEKEGIPGAIVEAMASGLPVVSTFHSGIPSIIGNEREGLLVPEYDAAALAGAISRMIAGPELRERLGRRARERAMGQLDLSKRELELEAIYDRLLQEGTGPGAR
jgi:colanic acid/amylovoran biosynthesis glycosyltransferase